jgi:hypothetical protein
LPVAFPITHSLAIALASLTVMTVKDNGRSAARVYVFGDVWLTFLQAIDY